LTATFPGEVRSSHGMTRPINMNATKFRTLSIMLLNESCLRCASARNRPSQFNAFPATKHASVSSAPKQPHVPTTKIYYQLIAVASLQIVTHLPRWQTEKENNFRCRPISYESQHCSSTK
jgi:hypothetical protein